MADYEIRRNAGIGSSWLIVIFIVLCLTTFGLLSLGNAKNDALLSERNAEAVQEYYRADCLGETFLQQVDQAVLEAGQSGAADPEELKRQVIAQFGDYYQEDTDRICTEIPMKAGQALRIELLPDWAGGSCRVAVWRVYNQEDYEIDQSIRVWKGGE